MKPTVHRTDRREGGFTLIEILVVITIIAALIAIVAAVIPRATAANRKTQCANNLRNIGGMLQERMAGKGIGSASGSAMLLQTYSKWFMIRKGDERVFLCPGDPRQQVIDDADFRKRYESIDLTNVDPELISYAGINRAIYPLKMDSREKQAMAVDCQGTDGRSGHHPDGVNCLFDDASVLFLDREYLGLGPEDPIVVGPESNQELLKKFIVR